MPLRRAALILAGLAVAGPVLTGCGGSPERAAPAVPTAAIQRPYVLVSGRDDHGLLAQDAVPLLAAPEETARQVGVVSDGTLAHVLDARGSWVRVAPVSGGSPPGWVDDYYLRGVVHLVGPAPSCRVTLGGHRLAAGEQAVVTGVRGGRVRVRLVRRPAVTGLVPVRYARELPPSPDDPCPRR